MRGVSLSVTYFMVIIIAIVHSVGKFTEAFMYILNKNPSDVRKLNESVPLSTEPEKVHGM